MLAFWLLIACSPIVDTSPQFADGGTLDISKAIEYLDKIIEHDQINAEALFQRAQLELQLGRMSKAKSDILAALAEDPLNLDYLVLKAKISDHLGQLQEALRTIEFIQEKGLSLSTVESQLFASDIYLKSNNLSKAEYYLQKATAHAPLFPTVLFHRARYYALGQDTVKALSFYKLLLQKDSTHLGGLMGVSELYLQKKQPDSCLFFLTKIPDNKSSVYNVLMAKSLMALNKSDSASFWWEVALQQSPRLAEAHYELGKYYLAKKDYSNARAHLASVPDNERVKYPDYPLLFAKVSYNLADSVNAAYYYQKALELDSSLVHQEKQFLVKKSKTPTDSAK